MSQRIMLDQDEVTPLHHQVYLVLRQQIDDGSHAPDRPMPSEPELTEMFGVSRITIRRALDRLQGEGLITRSRGRGTFPIKSQTQAAPFRTELSGNFDNLLAMGLQTRARLIEFSYVLPPANVQEMLNVGPDQKVQRAVRVRSVDDKPFSHLTTYVPQAIGASFSSADLEEKPLLVLFEQQGHRVQRATQAISARLADHQIAQLLEVSIGSALLFVKRLVRDANDQPVEYLEALYRPDIYEYSQELTRGGGDGGPVWHPTADQTEAKV